MLSKTLDEAESEDWICELGNEFCKQMELYSEYPEEKVCMVENKSVHNACILCLVYNVTCIDSINWYASDLNQYFIFMIVGNNSLK